MSYILGIDIGFGDCKCVIGDHTGIFSKYKFPSVIAAVEVNDYMTDPRAVHHDGNNYYVGRDAMHLEASFQQSVDEYKHLEAFTPIILKTILSKLDRDRSISSVVVGLSVAHMKYSKNYFLKVREFLNSAGCEDTKLQVLPQGSGVKLAYDKYGSNFPEVSTDLTSGHTYLLCDIGFNTVDILYVIEGKVSPNRIGGMENMGLVVVAKMLYAEIQKTYQNLDLSIKDLKEILDKGSMKLRGVNVDLRDVTHDLKNRYLKMIESMLESEYGKIMNKVDYLLLSGGGATYFSDIATEFYRTTGPESSYYNAIGYFIRGSRLSE